jgi:hypothetical protein
VVPRPTLIAGDGTLHQVGGAVEHGEIVLLEVGEQVPA